MTVLRPALLPVKTAQFTQFFPSGMTSHSKIAQFNWECTGRFTVLSSKHKKSECVCLRLCIRVQMEREGFILAVVPRATCVCKPIQKTREIYTTYKETVNIKIMADCKGMWGSNSGRNWRDISISVSHARWQTSLRTWRYQTKRYLTSHDRPVYVSDDTKLLGITRHMTDQCTQLTAPNYTVSYPTQAT
jgi:hypothetical protein